MGDLTKYMLRVLKPMTKAVRYTHELLNRRPVGVSFAMHHFQRKSLLSGCGVIDVSEHSSTGRSRAQPPDLED
jgi:hypothetical protein